MRLCDFLNSLLTLFNNLRSVLRLFGIQIFWMNLHEKVPKSRPIHLLFVILWRLCCVCVCQSTVTRGHVDLYSGSGKSTCRSRDREIGLVRRSHGLVAVYECTFDTQNDHAAPFEIPIPHVTHPRARVPIHLQIRHQGFILHHRAFKVISVSSAGAWLHSLSHEMHHKKMHLLTPHIPSRCTSSHLISQDAPPHTSHPVNDGMRGVRRCILLDQVDHRQVAPNRHSVDNCRLASPSSKNPAKWQKHSSRTLFSLFVMCTAYCTCVLKQGLFTCIALFVLQAK